jgi:hypothetical protein
MRWPGYLPCFLAGDISTLSPGIEWRYGWGTLALLYLKFQIVVSEDMEPGYVQPCDSLSRLFIPKLGDQVIQIQFMELGR